MFERKVANLFVDRLCQSSFGICVEVYWNGFYLLNNDINQTLNIFVNILWTEWTDHLSRSVSSFFFLLRSFKHISWPVEEMFGCIDCRLNWLCISGLPFILKKYFKYNKCDIGCYFFKQKIVYDSSRAAQGWAYEGAPILF